MGTFLQLSKIHECRHLLEKAQKETLIINTDAGPSKEEPEAAMQAIKEDLLSTRKQLETDHKKRLQVLSQIKDQSTVFFKPPDPGLPSDTSFYLNTVFYFFKPFTSFQSTHCLS